MNHSWQGGILSISTKVLFSCLKTVSILVRADDCEYTVKSWSWKCYAREYQIAFHSEPTEAGKIEIGRHCGILKEPSGEGTKTHQPILSASLKSLLIAYELDGAGELAKPRVLLTCSTSLSMSVLTGQLSSPCSPPVTQHQEISRGTPCPRLAACISSSRCQAWFS